MRFPDSIGLFYSAFTYYLGFKVNSGEYKMMGLAPYADRSDRQTSKFVDQIKQHLLTIHPDGSISFEYVIISPSTKKCEWFMKSVGNNYFN